jgi:hypothetical protein
MRQPVRGDIYICKECGMELETKADCLCSNTENVILRCCSMTMVKVAKANTFTEKETLPPKDSLETGKPIRTLTPRKLLAEQGMSDISESTIGKS